MADWPLFSIVIPAYNYGGVVARAVESACAQPGDDYEVIAIDDGSSDDTGAVLDRCAERFAPRLKVIHQANAGLAAVRNRGAREARGEYVIYLDADDELVADALDPLRVVLANGARPGMVAASHIAVYPSGREKLHVQKPLPADRRQCFLRYLRKELSLSNGAVAMRRDTVLENPYPEGVRQAEDIPVFLLLLARYDCVTIEAPMLRIHKHAGSMRHDVAASKATSLKLVEILFDSGRLPDEYQVYRREFTARRSLSLFRSCYRGGDYAAALHFYRTALACSPVLACSPKYLAKVCLAIWRRAFP